MRKKLWFLFGHICLCASSKSSLGWNKEQQSVWRSPDLVSPMSHTCRASEVLLGQGWQKLFIKFGLNKQMQELFFMLQGMKPEFWT